MGIFMVFLGALLLILIYCMGTLIVYHIMRACGWTPDRQDAPRPKS